MRSSWRIQWSVMRALFLRESVTRLAAGRTAWLWILLEPLAHVIFLMGLFGFILHRVTAGVDGAMFIMTGLFGFFMARNTATRCMEAISANTALFTYRQVKPIDPVVVRAGLEGFLTLISALILLTAAGLSGFKVLPKDPLMVLQAFTGLWLLGLGLGLVLSVVTKLLRDLGRLIRILFIPLYFISGVMHPALSVPQPYRDWMLVNPILHGLEMLRAGFFPQFHAAPGASLGYLYGVSMTLVFFGLALHVRYSEKLVAQ